MNTDTKEFFNDFITLNIHRTEIPHLDDATKKFVEDHAQIEFYPNGLKKGKSFDKTNELKTLVDQFKQRNDENIKCLIFDQFVEVLNRMNYDEMVKFMENYKA